MCFIYRLLEAGWRSRAKSTKYLHRSTNLQVPTCKNPAIAVAKAISTVAKLNKNKHEDSKHDCDNVVYVCFSKSSPGNKTHLILNNAVLIDGIYLLLPYSVIKMGKKCSI